MTRIPARCDTGIWRTKAACRDVDPEVLFVTSGEDQAAVAERLCSGCPVRRECLAFAMDNDVRAGVWGGVTSYRRGWMRRQHPEVTDWWTRLVVERAS